MKEVKKLYNITQLLHGKNHNLPTWTTYFNEEPQVGKRFEAFSAVDDERCIFTAKIVDIDYKTITDSKGDKFMVKGL